jgi:GxxExxY protein
MHPSFEKAAGLTEMIIAAAIEVHRDKGPGLIESIYEWCLLKELGCEVSNVSARNQFRLNIKDTRETSLCASMSS